MRISRRELARMAAGLAALPVAARAAWALDYPTRPVHLLVGFPPGGAPDIVARVTGQWLAPRLDQQVVIDNRPGAGSNIATEMAAKAAPDGYTLLLTVSANAINATLYANLNFDFLRDLAPVASIGRTAFVIVVNPAFPAKTLPELIAQAKANPGKIDMATAGIGSGSHVSGELLQMMAGIKLTHVPYRGNYITDLLSGQISLAFSVMPQVVEFVKDGRLRALGVTTAARSELLPDVPAIGEVVAGYDASGWFGICAPTGVPAEIVARLNPEISAVVADPHDRARLLALGVEPRPMTTAEFGTFIADETAKWRKVIKFAALKPG